MSRDWKYCGPSGAITWMIKGSNAGRTSPRKAVTTKTTATSTSRSDEFLGPIGTPLTRL